MIIEQTLMRLMESSGEFTRGCGLNPNTFIKWTQNMGIVNEICQSIEDF